jgi:hypothetical protein
LVNGCISDWRKVSLFASEEEFPFFPVFASRVVSDARVLALISYPIFAAVLRDQLEDRVNRYYIVEDCQTGQEWKISLDSPEGGVSLFVPISRAELLGSAAYPSGRRCRLMEVTPKGRQPIGRHFKQARPIHHGPPSGPDMLVIT